MSLAGFVRASQTDVWRLAAHLVDQRSADDVTQEVYLRAIPALARYRAEAPARIWLLTIARRTCADVLRRRGRQRRLWQRIIEQPDPARLHGGPPDTGEIDLDDILEDLDPERRTAFVLTQTLGLSYAETADICRVPIGTIRSRVGPVTQTLRFTIDEPGSFDFLCDSHPMMKGRLHAV